LEAASDDEQGKTVNIIVTHFWENGGEALYALVKNGHKKQFPSKPDKKIFFAGPS
jgi:hypothetical protein